MKFSGFAILFWLLVGSSWATDFKTADELYDNKEFDKAYLAYKNLATIGDAYSQYRLGVMYLQGEGVAIDYAKAVGWLRVAHDNAPSLGADTLANEIEQQLELNQIKLDLDSTTNSLLSQYGRSSIHEKFTPIFLEDKDCKHEQPKWTERPTPKYPKKAFRNQLVGTSRVRYNISSEGYPRDIELVGHTHKLFKKASIQATQKWKHEPSSSPGLQYEYMTTQLDFNIESKQIQSAKVSKSLEKLHSAAKAGGPAEQYELANTLSYWKRKLKAMGYKHASFKDSGKWFHKAAQSGHPIARYEIGSRMVRGMGCKEDEEGGLAWLRASAIAGYGPAQGELAQLLLKKPNSDLQEILQFLRDASQSGHYLSSVNLAWLLSTHPDPRIRNGEEALTHLAKEHDYYFDEVRILETKAAAYAALGNYKQAASYQDDALDEAEDLEWDIPVMEQRYKAYKDKSVWQGEYYL